MEDYINHPSSLMRAPKTKFLAAHFPATLLKIDGFKFVAIHQMDLEARCYYARKRLMWEILDRDKWIKYKIEIEWDNILAMRAIMEENKPGILEIELDKPPKFYHETEGRGNRTAWKQSKDFTQGHALTFRRHYIEFPFGVLNKHYERLLQCDQRLKGLSQLPFPSLVSPYFGLGPSYQGGLCGTSHTHSTSNHQSPFLISSQQAVPGQFGRIMSFPSLMYSTSQGPLSYQGGLCGTLATNSTSHHQAPFLMSPQQSVPEQFGRTMPLPPSIYSTSLRSGNTQPPSYVQDNGDFGVITGSTDSGSGMENRNLQFREPADISVFDYDIEEYAAETEGMQSCGLGDKINFSDVIRGVAQDFEMNMP